jgi:hypothetical protein
VTSPLGVTAGVGGKAVNSPAVGGGGVRLQEVFIHDVSGTGILHETGDFYSPFLYHHHHYGHVVGDILL